MAKRYAQNNLGLFIVAALAVFIALRSAHVDSVRAQDMASRAALDASEANVIALQVQDDLETLDGRVDEACWRLNYYC